MNKIGLIIIFNHKFDKNLNLLRKIYKERFSNILFIVPFYNGKDDDVVAVYENSYHFQGYIAQAYNKIKELNCEHYVFIGDDLILNPDINENNICQQLNLQINDAYIESLIPLNEIKWYYHRFKSANDAFKGYGINYENEIPKLEYAKNKAKEYGFNNCEIHRNFRNNLCDNNTIKSKIKDYINHILFPIEIKYPLVTGYSDFFVLPSLKLDQFCQICGVFAGMNLFVEIAIPTTLMLIMDCNNLKMQKDVDVITEKMWCVSDFVTNFEKQCDFCIEKMKDNWPKKYLYMHPVKLSKWTMNE